MKHKLRMIWRILRDRQVVVITESYGRMYYDWDTRSLEDVCQMYHKVHDLAYIMNNNDNNLEILEEFTYSILKDLKSLEPDISQLVDGYFWHLVVQNLKK